jgi:hypothetical protein
MHTKFPSTPFEVYLSVLKKMLGGVRFLNYFGQVHEGLHLRMVQLYVVDMGDILTLQCFLINTKVYYSILVVDWSTGRLYI